MFEFYGKRAKYIDDEQLVFVTEDARLFRRLKTRVDPKELTQTIHVSGYKYVSIKIGDIQTNRPVHRWVAESFVDNPNNLETVDHIDENKLNNNYTNLRWFSNYSNSKEYSEKNARSKYIKLMDAKISRTKDSLKEYNKVIDDLSAKEVDLRNNIKKLCSREEEVEGRILSLLQRAKDENRRLESQRSKTYGSVEEMVTATGIPVKVNEVVYPSAGSAAQHIVDSYENASSKATISKAIRRMLQGKRQPWRMYDRFYIDLI